MLYIAFVFPVLYVARFLRRRTVRSATSLQTPVRLGFYSPPHVCRSLHSCRDRPFQLWLIIPLHLQILSLPTDQPRKIDTHTSHDIEGIPVLPLLTALDLPNVAIPVHGPGSFVAVDDLREDTDTFEIRVMPAETVQTEIKGYIFALAVLMVKKLLCAPEGQGVGVDADAAVRTEDDTSRIIVSGHVWVVAKGDAMIWGGNSGIVVDHESAKVLFVVPDAAVSRPEQVPIIAVW